MSAIHDQLKNLRIPAFVAPMFLVSTPELVVAACRSGVVGTFPSPNLRTSAEMGEWMARINRELSEAEAQNDWAIAPWALNVVTHSTNPRLADDLEQIRIHQPPIVITALGSPKPVISTVKEYGGIVLADVISEELARKAIKAGADGLVLVCSGAGGHTGELSPFVFVERVRQFFDGYIALAGAVSNGSAILAAQTLGADFGYIGTPFIAAEESSAEAEYKQMLIDCSASDLMVTRAMTGARASMLKPSMVNQGLDPADLENKVAKMNFTGRKDQEVKPWKGIWGAGQGLGKIEMVEPAAKIVERLVIEYEKACSRMGVICQ